MKWHKSGAYAADEQLNEAGAAPWPGKAKAGR